MSWEEITPTRGNRWHTGTPIATFQAAGGLHLNRAALDLLHGAERVSVLIDAERRCLGLLPSTSLTAYRVCLVGRSRSNARVSIATACRQLGVELTPGQTFPARLEDGVLVIGPLPVRETGTLAVPAVVPPVLSATVEAELRAVLSAEAVK